MSNAVKCADKFLLEGILNSFYPTFIYIVLIA